jgi:diguanylate cyclase (GGDEF)-like protein
MATLFQMPKKTFYSKLLLAAILMTFIAIVAKGWIPQKHMSLVPMSPSINANYFLLPIPNDPEGKKSFFTNPERTQFRCEFNAEDRYSPCNLVYVLSDKIPKGMNLNAFNAIKLDITYKGKANWIRLGIRNFDPRFSTTNNDNSSKYNYINLRTADLHQPLYIELNEFVVAEWWLSQFNISRELSHPDLSNAITFSVDFIEDLSNTENEVRINQLEFVGDWISNEHWYLMILLVWLIAGAILATLWLINLLRVEKIAQRRISDLVVSNANLRTETDKFRKLSTVDGLTNAFNRYGIEQIIESAELRLHQAALIMIDIDHFKRVNDRRGHDAGDRVLKKFSDIVMSRTRATDKFGRWGGEEFVLICPNTSVGMAMALAEKLRILISDTVFEPDNPLAVTASFGIASINDEEDFTSTFKRADEALYKAKEIGRNCVIVAEKELTKMYS